MNDNYLFEYANLLERVLSFAHQNKYSLNATEKAISYSMFFQNVEKSGGVFAPIIEDSVLVKQLFPEITCDLSTVSTYVQCLWAAEAYLWIQEETKLTFECIFLYLPIQRMYDYFPLYHEMDFSQIVNEFIRLYQEKSVLALLIEKYHYLLVDVAEECSCSYDVLFSYKQRRRDIKKASVSLIYKLARLFHVRMATISALEV